MSGGAAEVEREGAACLAHLCRYHSLQYQGQRLGEKCGKHDCWRLLRGQWSGLPLCAHHLRECQPASTGPEGLPPPPARFSGKQIMREEAS